MDIETLYALDTGSQAIQWKGTPESTELIRTWTGHRIREAYGALLLQSPDLVEQVLPGDYIVRRDIGSFYCWKPKEVAENYAKGIPQAQAV